MLNMEEIRKYRFIGLRGLCPDEDYKVGDSCRESYDWNREIDSSSFYTDEPETLGGTCASKVVDVLFYLDQYEDDEIEEGISKALKSFRYLGKKSLIGSNDCWDGEDDGEIIMMDAKFIQYL